MYCSYTQSYLLCLFLYFTGCCPHYLINNALESYVNGVYVCSNTDARQDNNNIKQGVILCFHINNYSKLYTTLVTTSSGGLEKRIYIEIIDGKLKGKRLYGSVWTSNSTNTNWKNLITSEYENTMIMIPLPTNTMKVVSYKFDNDSDSSTLSHMSHFLLMELYGSMYDNNNDNNNDNDNDNDRNTLLNIIVNQRKQHNIAIKDPKNYISRLVAISTECEYYVFVDNWQQSQRCYQYMDGEIWLKQGEKRLYEYNKINQRRMLISKDNQYMLSTSILSCTTHVNQMK